MSFMHKKKMKELSNKDSHLSKIQIHITSANSIKIILPPRIIITTEKSYSTLKKKI